jgi:hypothetical protein
VRFVVFDTMGCLLQCHALFAHTRESDRVRGAQPKSVSVHRFAKDARGSASLPSTTPHDHTHVPSTAEIPVNAIGQAIGCEGQGGWIACARESRHVDHSQSMELVSISTDSQAGFGRKHGGASKPSGSQDWRIDWTPTVVALVATVET